MDPTQVMLDMLARLVTIEVIRALIWAVVFMVAARYILKD